MHITKSEGPHIVCLRQERKEERERQKEQELRREAEKEAGALCPAFLVFRCVSIFWAKASDARRHAGERQTSEAGATRKATHGAKAAD